MYLISIYFDEKTARRIQRYIDKVAEVTGNRYMKEAEVPPHMTVGAFETLNEEAAILALQRVAKRLEVGGVCFAGVGQFFPNVLFLIPVLNQYLHSMSELIQEEFGKIENLRFDRHYQPFSWQPHTTIGKKLDENEMKAAFEVMQNSFGVLEGSVVRIGLAKPNPHQDIKVCELKIRQ